MSENKKNRILICSGTSGVSAGCGKVRSRFEEELRNRGIESDWEIVSVGDRGLFRDVLVDIMDSRGRVSYEYVSPEDVSGIAESHLVGGGLFNERLAGDDYKNFFEKQTRIVLSNCGEIDPDKIDEYIERQGYAALKKALDSSPEEVIEEIKDSGLRGRGGAGFLAGLKWEFTRNASGSEKYVVCNADEGDPGAFMDRSILEGDPHSVIEGMAIAGYAAGAGEGFIYCRAEYPLAIKKLKKAISLAEKEGFLGDNILSSGFSFRLNIKEGAGAFVCGEETALLASIEGRRGMPVPRPPFPAVEGLWGKPTLINNVETLANVRHIILNGAKWFSSMGSGDSKGTKVFALAGKVKNTGLVEVPMGTTLRDLIFGPGGGMAERKSEFKGVQIGGPSGGCLPEDLLDTSIDYESLNATGAIMGSGGMIVMDTGSCMVDIAKFFLDFTVAESCGKCVPCRVGLKRMQEVVELITYGKGTDSHIDFLRDMGNTIKNTALCGLGNTAPSPVLTTLRYFDDEYRAHIDRRSCPSLVCIDLLNFEVNEELCKKCGKCLPVCPSDAISWRKKEFARIDKDKCIKCRACIVECPFKAIE